MKVPPIAFLVDHNLYRNFLFSLGYRGESFVFKLRFFSELIARMYVYFGMLSSENSKESIRWGRSKGLLLLSTVANKQKHMQ